MCIHQSEIQLNTRRICHSIHSEYQTFFKEILFFWLKYKFKAFLPYFFFFSCHFFFNAQLYRCEFNLLLKIFIDTSDRILITEILSLMMTHFMCSNKNYVCLAQIKILVDSISFKSVFFSGFLLEKSSFTERNLNFKLCLSKCCWNLELEFNNTSGTQIVNQEHNLTKVCIKRLV